MVFLGLKKASWTLITLLPLVFIVNAHGGSKKEDKTTPSPQNVSRDNNDNITRDYGIYYYEYPEGLFMNETYNNTYGTGFFDYNDYYRDYYVYYAYPELIAYYDQMEDNSTQNSVPTLMTTKKPERGTKKPKAIQSRHKTRSLPEASEISHLCLMNLLNVMNLFDKRIPYIFKCKDKKFKHFACYNSDGFIKPCYEMKDEKKTLVPLCVIKKGNTSYVTTCNSLDPQSFCFTTPREMNKIALCKDEKFRVCLNGSLSLCNSQEKKRISQVIASLPKDQHKPDVNKRERQAIVNLPKDQKRPDVNERLRPAIFSPIRINTKQVRKRATISSPENKNRTDVQKRVSRGIVTPSKDKTRPDVSCKNCKVDVKMIVDEMTDKYPRVLINVSKLDASEKMDMEDDDFDK